jgi:hypothetical protein
MNMNKLGYKPEMQKEMSSIEQLGLERHIDYWLADGGSRFSASAKFGLPYTQGDEYAGLWNSNFSGKVENLIVVGFALTKNHVPIMILKDDKDNKSYYEI